MRKIKLLILPLLLVCLMGCSKTDPNEPITVKWENGTTTINGNQVYFTEYSGTNATIEAGQGGYDWYLAIDTAKDVTSITVNNQGIQEENMDTFKKKFYYTEYLNTQFTMAANIGVDTWAICKTYTERNSEPNVTAAYASEYIDLIPLTYNQVKVDFGSFIFSSEYDTVIVRPSCALVSGVIKVSADAHACSESYTIIQNDKEYQLMRDCGKKYDYYTYDGLTIQILAGMDISEYITFK